MHIITSSEIATLCVLAFRTMCIHTCSKMATLLAAYSRFHNSTYAYLEATKWLLKMLEKVRECLSAQKWLPDARLYATYLGPKLSLRICETNISP
jgi:hypothetical protein